MSTYRGGMTDADETAELAALDIFLPSPPPDHAAQEAFLDEAAALALDGHPITVYLQDEDAWAFEECEPVRALLDSAGDAVLPVTLLGLDIVVSSVYPTTAQMERFAGEGKTPLIFAREGRVLGIIAVADTVRETSRAAIRRFREMGQIGIAHV